MIRSEDKIRDLRGCAKISEEEYQRMHEQLDTTAYANVNEASVIINPIRY